MSSPTSQWLFSSLPPVLPPSGATCPGALQCGRPVMTVNVMTTMLMSNHNTRTLIIISRIHHNLMSPNTTNHDQMTHCVVKTLMMCNFISFLLQYSQPYDDIYTHFLSWNTSSNTNQGLFPGSVLEEKTKKASIFQDVWEP